jgi:hypothetical protein
MGHRDLLVTQNLSDGEHHSCRPHPRGSVRRASGFVLTGKPEVEISRWDLNFRVADQPEARTTGDSDCVVPNQEQAKL